VADRPHARVSRDAHRHAGPTALALVLVALAAGQAIAATPKGVAVLRITLTRTTTTVAVGAPIVVRGNLSPASRGYTLRLQRRRGSRWTTVQLRRSSANGAFAFSLATRAPASAPFRVIAGSARHPLAASRVIRVAVSAKTATIAPPLTPAIGGVVIGTTVLPFGTLGAAYRAKLSTTDARAGAWSIASGGLPPGLTLASSGLVTGTPVALGTSNFVVAFNDAANLSSTQQLALSVYPPPVVTRISTGTSTTCALRVDRTVACWGGDDADDLGTLAAGASGTLSTPLQVDDLIDATDVSVGGVLACALHATGIPVCWGHNNTHGALGNGTRLPARTPTAVVGIADAVAVATGGSFGCALRRAGTVSCWGANGPIGDLGDGTLDDSVVSTSVVGITDATQISAGDGHACALRGTGTVSCWGSDAYGELGDGFAAVGSDVPVAVSGLTDATSVSAGEDDTCAVRATGAVVCWGAGAHGALGNGSLADSSTPVSVSGLSDAVSVAVGSDGAAPGQDGACALRASGSVVCWGAVGPGRNGNDTTLAVPVPASGLAGVTALALGYGFGCAIISGHPVCWGGDANGQVGLPSPGYPSFISMPTPVRGV
jgi:hypothetical protein